MDLSWDDPCNAPQEWFCSTAAAKFRDRLEQPLRRDFEESRRFVVKDPRLCRLIPLWIPVLKAISATPKFVFVIRNPLEVAASLKKRDNIPPGQALLLWLRHLIEAESATQPFLRVFRVFVNYEDLLHDWRGVMREVSTKLDLGWEIDSTPLHTQIGEFLSRSDRHHHVSAHDLLGREDVVSWVRKVYGVASQPPVDQAELRDVFRSVGKELAVADRAFGGFLGSLKSRLHEQQAARRELEEAPLRRDLLWEQARAKDLGARVADLERSLSWSLTQPLRTVANWAARLTQR